MTFVLTIIAIIVSVMLIVCVLLQSQGSGLSSSFGGSGGEFYRSKRSIEKLLVWGTTALAVIFAIISVLLLIPH